MIAAKKKKNYREILKKKGYMIHKKQINYVKGIETVFYWYNDREMFDKHRPVLEKKGYTYISFKDLSKDGALSAVYVMEVRG